MIKLKFLDGRRAGAVATTIAVVFLSASAASAQELVSVNQAGTASAFGKSTLALFFGTEQRVSAAGLFVVFESRANDLAANDMNDAQDVYVRDLRAGTTTLVSVNTAGSSSAPLRNPEVHASNPTISANGRFVAFDSLATDLDPNTADTDSGVLIPPLPLGSFQDVYIRDLQTGLTTLVSANSAGTDSANNFARRPSISADGRFVAFESGGNNLEAIDNDGGLDVFVRDLQTRTTTLVSVNSAGTGSGNGRSFDPVISGDGRFVVFSSDATDLIASDADPRTDVYVRDLLTATTILVSVNDAGTASGNARSDSAVVNGNGRYVAFQSRASDLVTADTNGFEDVFVHDLQAGLTTLISMNQAGNDSGNGPSGRPFGRPAISNDGNFVAFESRASNLVASDGNGREDVFVRDLQAGTTALVSVNEAGTDSGNDLSGDPVISADGSVVAFVSLATDLVATDLDRAQDVYLRDLQAGTTMLISRNVTGIDSGNLPSGSPAISANGNVVAFDSRASDLDATDIDELQDVFVFERP